MKQLLRDPYLWVLVVFVVVQSVLLLLAGIGAVDECGDVITLIGKYGDAYMVGALWSALVLLMLYAVDGEATRPMHEMDAFLNVLAVLLWPIMFGVHVGAVILMLRSRARRPR